MSGALLDTSVLIASEAAAGELPAAAAISVVSVGELYAGVELARTPETRALRQSRLVSIRAAFTPIPVDELVAEQYGRVLALARRQNRAEKAADVLIVATAAATSRSLVTLDLRQAALARAAGVAVV